MDEKVLRTKAAEEELAAGTPIAEIPIKAQAKVAAVTNWINGTAPAAPPASPPPPPPAK